MTAPAAPWTAIEPVDFDRPTKGRLVVKLDNGEHWAATPDDLVKFGYVKPHEAYLIFDRALDRILREAGLLVGNLTEAAVNPLRFLVEIAICHPDLLDREDVAVYGGQIAAIERAARAADRHSADPGTDAAPSTSGTVPS